MIDLLSIKSPDDIKSLTISELNELADVIRSFLVEKISETGGHLASNLGVVELTIALHYVFNSPQDKILFDVGHQAYVHKILTGRAKDFDTLRTLDGLSGYISREESKHDIWESGHSSTSISALSGMLMAHPERVIALIGDASIASGVAFEGLNFLSQNYQGTPIIIVNDNKMGINKSVGALALALNKMRGTKFKRDFKLALIKKLPLKLNRLMHSFKSKIKRKNLFENLGYDYYGPYEGTDIKGLIKVFESLKNVKKPVIVHVITRKGQGYEPAENNMINYHGISGTNHHNSLNCALSYSKVIGNKLIQLRQEKPFKVINPAMLLGSELAGFKDLYPLDCYDVGIAEAHAVCMASGMAINQGKVFVSMYSTFAQRAFDHLLNDVARNKLCVKFLFDRAGIVGEDGETHQGIYDLAMLNLMPNMTICMPKDASEAEALIDFMYDYPYPIVMRYPKLNALLGNPIIIKDMKWEIIQKGNQGIIITYGSDINRVIDLKLDAYIINARFIRPIDEAMLNELVSLNLPILVYEQVVNSGSLAQMVGNYLANIHFDMHKYRYLNLGDNTVVKHGAINEVMNRYHLGDKDIIKVWEELCA